MWTAEIRNVLLAYVLGRGDVAVFQDKTMFMQKPQLHAEIVTLLVTTPAISFFVSCQGSHHERTKIPENTCFEGNGRLFNQRVKGLAQEVQTLRLL